MENDEIINKEISILQLIPSLNTEEVKRDALEISQALIKNNFVSHIASNEGALLKNLLSQGATHHKLPFDRKGIINFFKSFMELNKILETNTIGLIHAHSKWSAWIGYYIAKKKHIPFITSFHDIYGFKNFIKKYYNSIMTKGEKIIAVSNFVKQHLVESYNIPEDKIVVINEAINLSIFTPEKVGQERVIQLAEKIRLRNFDKTIIMVPGEIIKSKGHHLLIEALSKLKNQEFICLLVGEERKNNNYKKQITQIIKDAYLEDRVFFTGPISDMTAAYKLSDIVISCATEPESFGRIAIETQAMGRIILATNLGGFKEVIEDKKNGFLFEPNVTSLTETLEMVMNLDFEEKQKIQKAAIINAQENFSIGQMLDKTLDLYRNILIK